MPGPCEGCSRPCENIYNEGECLRNTTIDLAVLSSLVETSTDHTEPEAPEDDNN